MDLRLQITQQLKENFTTAHLKETAMVSIYCKKMDQLLEAMDSLDLTQMDEDGNIVFRGQLLTLMMALKEIQSMVAKLSGTDAGREYAIYCKKISAKAKVAASNGVIDVHDMETTFMDDVKDYVFEDGDDPDFIQDENSMRRIN